MTTVPSLSEIDELARQIHVLEAHATERAQSAIELKVEIGRRLLRAKEILPHGKFGAWAEQEFGWDRPRIHRHMKLAEVANVVGLQHLMQFGVVDPAAVLKAVAAESSNGEPEKRERVRFAIVVDGGESLEIEFAAESTQGAFLIGATSQGQSQVLLVRCA